MDIKLHNGLFGGNVCIQNCIPLLLKFSSISCQTLYLSQETHPLLLHVLVRSDRISSNCRRNICYKLCNAGLSANHQDQVRSCHFDTFHIVFCPLFNVCSFHQEGNTPLHLAVASKSQGSAQLCMALLQCGADMNTPNHVGAYFSVVFIF